MEHLQTNLSPLSAHPSYPVNEGVVSHDAFRSSILITFTLIVSYVATGLYIAHKDVTGQWQQYDLRNVGKTKKPPRTWAMYSAHALNQVRDLCFFLPTGLYVTGLGHEASLWANETDSAWYWLCQAGWVAVLYVLQQIWLGVVHYILHSKYFYSSIHKHHHVPIDMVHSLAVWADAWPEYISMELGSYMICMVLLPVHTYVWMGYMVFIGITSSIEHSGFFVNWLFDSRYHWIHHTKFVWNYAEWELLDQLCGTLYNGPDPFSALAHQDEALQTFTSDTRLLHAVADFSDRDPTESFPCSSSSSSSPSCSSPPAANAVCTND